MLERWVSRDGEIVLRLPDVIAGTLCIPAIYFLDKTLVRPRESACWRNSNGSAAAYAVWYSQGARQLPLILAYHCKMLFAVQVSPFSRWYDYGWPSS